MKQQAVDKLRSVKMRYFFVAAEKNRLKIFKCNFFNFTQSLSEVQDYIVDYEPGNGYKVRTIIMVSIHGVTEHAKKLVASYPNHMPRAYDVRLSYFIFFAESTHTHVQYVHL